MIAFLGLLFSLLLTLPQTPLYQAGASLEIQSFNENLLNMRNVAAMGSRVGGTRRGGFREGSGGQAKDQKKISHAL